MNLCLEQALAWIKKTQPQAVLVGGPRTQVQRVHTDTRTLERGDFFVALRGERFDANDFLPQAQAQGAVAAIASGDLKAAGLIGIQVPDSLEALGALAAGWRSQWNIPLVAVTGSNGKTTVTQMIASIFHAYAGEAALATQGNLNNAIGVPLTLLRMNTTHQLGVVEMGMNHPGEIAALAGIVQPTVALVNNAQREHLEFMGTVDAVAQENGSIFRFLPRNGIAVFPADDAFSGLWRSIAADRRTMTFGVESALANVTLRHPEWCIDHWNATLQWGDQQMDVELHLAGVHNLHNAAAAAAAALAAGVSLPVVAQGLAQFRAVKGRSRLLSITCGGRVLPVIDDTYNANPDSVIAAIDVLKQLPSPRLLVLGDMGEVGTQGPALHTEVGHYAQACEIERVFCLGDLSFHTADAHDDGTHFENVKALLEAVQAVVPAVGSILVKGSRFMRMEQVVQMLEQQGTQMQPQQAMGVTCS